MENSLKQRIVGAVVLIALAIIFLPAILKQKDQPQPFHSKIPAKPIAAIETQLSDAEIAKNSETQAALDRLSDKLPRKVKSTESSSKVPGNSNGGEANSEPIVNYTQPVVKTEPVANSETGANHDKADTSKNGTSVNLDTSVTNDSRHQAGQLPDNLFKQSAWVIQIASFSNRENALNFVNRLKQSGHRAYRREVNSAANATIFRVFVGPFMEKKDAEKTLSELNKEGSLKGIILAFDPVKH